MIHRLSLAAEQSILLDTISLPSAIQAHTCFTTPYCDFHSKYQTLDGSCNDPYNPNSQTIANLLGQPMLMVSRLSIKIFIFFFLQVMFKMILGIDALRAASDGSPLASARNVSLTVFDDQTETRFRPHFGHHAVRTVYQSRLAIHSSAFSSVLNGSTIPQDLADKSCLPIPISPDDEFFNANGTVRKTCMNFVRSITGPRLD